MRLLLDTHALIWSLARDPRLSPEALAAIRDGDNAVAVSAASVWEIRIKQSLGKLQVPDNLASLMAAHRFDALPISIEHADRAGELPRLHRDPFDRMLVAQAQIESLVLVTRDRSIKQYAVETLDA